MSPDPSTFGAQLQPIFGHVCPWLLATSFPRFPLVVLNIPFWAKSGDGPMFLWVESDVWGVHAANPAQLENGHTPQETQQEMIRSSGLDIGFTFGATGTGQMKIVPQNPTSRNPVLQLPNPTCPARDKETKRTTRL